MQTLLAYLKSLPFLVLLIPLLMSVAPAQAEVSHSEVVITWLLNSPTAMAVAPDGRIFITEQGGIIRIVKNGGLLPTPFASLSVAWESENGLIGIALDPDFVNNPYVYVHYTIPTPPDEPEAPVHNRISRLTANGDVMLPGSEQILLELDQIDSSGYHVGGALSFGPDGKLYIAVGDNSLISSRSLNTFAGKLLRINRNGSIPTNNPFYAEASGQHRAIWAIGLRNPFSFAFDPGSSRFFINDVGETSWEEINQGVAGADYGWPLREGYTNDSRFRSPIYAYPHEGDCSAITGGVFYRSSTPQFPARYQGDYLFSDYCAGWIKSYDVATNQVSMFVPSPSGGSAVDLDVSPNGGIYYLNYTSGSLYEIVSADAAIPPTIVSTSADTTSILDQGNATLACDANGSSPLHVRWRQNGVDVDNGQVLVLGDYNAEDGDRFRCVASNEYGTVISDPITISVNSTPEGRIVTPAADALVLPGQTIQFQGEGTDDEDSTLLPSAYTWKVEEWLDNTLVRTIMEETSDLQEGSFTIPDADFSPDTHYRITMSITDSDGISKTYSQMLFPAFISVTISSFPLGRQFSVDGTLYYSVATLSWHVRTEHEIAAITPQLASDGTWEFLSWSDGGDAQHTIITPSEDTTFVARYTNEELTAPDTPILLTPANGSTVNDYPTSNLTWGSVSRATIYELQIDNDSDFSSPLIDSHQSFARYTMRETLPFGQLYWRVRALNVEEEASAWSEPFSFTWTEAPPPPVPTLIAPENNSTVSSAVPPQLSWSDVGGSAQYQLQIDDQNDLSSPFVNIQRISSVYRPSGSNLANGTPYYWRVQAVTNHLSGWSEIYSFTWNTVISPPTLLEPINGELFFDDVSPPTFMWSNVAGAAQYELQADDQPDFSSPWISAQSSSRDYTPDELAYGATYWRVRAVAINGTVSEWSPAFWYHVPHPSSAVPNLNYYTTLPAVLTWNRISWATQYEIQIARNQNFNNIAQNEVVPASTLSLTISDLPDGTYYWRVRAIRNNGVPGTWSSIGTFILNLRL